MRSTSAVRSPKSGGASVCERGGPGAKWSSQHEFSRVLLKENRVLVRSGAGGGNGMDEQPHTTIDQLGGSEMERPRLTRHTLLAALVVVATVAAACSGTSETTTTTSTDPPAATPTQAPSDTVTDSTASPGTTTTTQASPDTTSIDRATRTTAADTEPPELIVTDPKNGSTVTAATYRFRGTTEPGAKVVAAGIYNVGVDPSGSWSIVLTLVGGKNSAVFVATDDAGNQTTVRLSVIFKPDDDPLPEPSP